MSLINIDIIQLTQKWAKSSTWKSMRCFQTIIIFEKKTVLKPLHAVERCLHRTGTLMAWIFRKRTDFPDAVQVLNILKIGDSSVRSTCTSDKTSLN